MKTILAVSCSALILLAIVLENTSASPLALPQQSGGSSPGGTKPGSCYRPGFGRKKRSLEEEEVPLLDQENQAHDDFLTHFIQKRQVQGGNTGSGGNQGGNPWRPTPTTTRRPVIRPQCYSDNGCPGNKKCCNGACQTPAFTG